MTYADFIKEWHNDSDAIICSTSGSTGIPKQIAIPKREMVVSARRTIDFFGLPAGSLFYSCISPDYIGGKMMAVRAIISGGRIGAETPSNSPLENYTGGPIDLLAVVPSQMHYLLERSELYPLIRHVLIGGAPIPPGLRKRIALSGIDAWETYGMTETASHVALRKVTADETGFTPLPGVSIATTPEGRLKITLAGWQTVVTNDIAVMNADGTFTIAGRLDNVINSGGKKVHPEQIEEAFEGRFGCPALLTSRPDEKWGERLVLIIEDAETIDDGRILEWFSDRFPRWCRPKEIIHSTLPRTANGKKRRGIVQKD